MPESTISYGETPVLGEVRNCSRLPENRSWKKVVSSQFSKFEIQGGNSTKKQEQQVVVATKVARLKSEFDLGEMSDKGSERAWKKDANEFAKAIVYCSKQDVCTGGNIVVKMISDGNPLTHEVNTAEVYLRHFDELEPEPQPVSVSFLV
ncbi:hypothetical protein FRX31_034431 [Thalictrum thalictroides]|uniref:Uncharacterized protein n=1 Tax=Thalictrum thalictroides TaxID=46969 RepID=A0A7J6UUR5_THATH|nr:hypothetical protein FRX31_034431 [Thalictrum thalictroides]